MSRLAGRPKLPTIAIDKSFGIGPHVAEPDLFLHLLLSYCAALERIGQKRVEIGFLSWVRMRRVIGSELSDDWKSEVEEPPLLESEIDRQTGCPGLGTALGIVKQLGVGGQVIEIVPFWLEETDRIDVLEPKIDPVEIVDLVRPQGSQIVGEPPMLQPRAIEQHHRTR